MKFLWPCLLFIPGYWILTFLGLFLFFANFVFVIFCEAERTGK